MDKNIKDLLDNNPLIKNLLVCDSTIEKLNRDLTAQKEIKNHLCQEIEKYYTELLGKVFYKLVIKNNSPYVDDVKIGRFNNVYYKDCGFFIEAWYIELTPNNKIIKNHFSMGVQDPRLSECVFLTEKEYKEELFNYLNSKIEIC